jgi:hypothetical protein
MYALPFPPSFFSSEEKKYLCFFSQWPDRFFFHLNLSAAEGSRFFEGEVRMS